MSTQRAGRRFSSLPADLPAARKRFALELRGHLVTSGLTLRRLAARTYTDLSTLSRYFSGTRLPPQGHLDPLAQALGLTDEDARQLNSLLNEAVIEAEGGVPASNAQDLPQELLRHMQAADMTVYELAARMGHSAEEVTGIVSGRLRPSPDQLRLLGEALRLNDEDRKHLASLVYPNAQHAVAVSDVLSALLADLRRQTHLSVREITLLVESSGVAVGKSSVDRALRDPAHSLQLSLHVAEVLIEELPREHRGPIRDKLFGALLALEGKAVLAAYPDLTPNDAEERGDRLHSGAVSLDTQAGEESPLHNVAAGDFDVLARLTRHIYEDERLQAVLRELNPSERLVLRSLAEAQETTGAERTTWAQAAAAAGATDPDHFGDRLRRKIMRLASVQNRQAGPGERAF
ncbi:helix-turn-helix domain-containing protein [Streptomyces umbrinus]